MRTPSISLDSFVAIHPVAPPRSNPCVSTVERIAETFQTVAQEGSWDFSSPHLQSLSQSVYATIIDLIGMGSASEEYRRVSNKENKAHYQSALPCSYRVRMPASETHADVTLISKKVFACGGYKRIKVSCTFRLTTATEPEAAPTITRINVIFGRTYRKSKDFMTDSPLEKRTEQVLRGNEIHKLAKELVGEAIADPPDFIEKMADGKLEFIQKHYVTSLAESLGGWKCPIVDEVVRVIRIATALDELHKHGLIHGDLKEGNLFLGDDMKGYLADFDMSGYIGTSSRASQRHWDPASRHFRMITPFTDAYSLACYIAYRLAPLPVNSFILFSDGTLQRSLYSTAFYSIQNGLPCPSAERTARKALYDLSLKIFQAGEDLYEHLQEHENYVVHIKEPPPYAIRTSTPKDRLKVWNERVAVPNETDVPALIDMATIKTRCEEILITLEAGLWVESQYQRSHPLT